jgi:sporulation protein YlmC with PRC-barrel domain
MPHHAGQADKLPTMIAASKVNGTKVYSRSGELLGWIYDVLLDRESGCVTYTVMAFGGFLGMGEKYHPVAWDQLRYCEAYAGYVVNIDKRVLNKTPCHSYLRYM